MTSRPVIAQTHYDALKVAPDAPIEVIRAAYRLLSQKYHPDRNRDGATAAGVMSSLNLAYDVLSNPSKKDAYDARLREGAASSDEGLVATTPAQAKKAVAPRARVRFPGFTRRRIVATLLLASTLGLAVTYALTQEHDPWLERAWQESWKADIHAGPAHVRPSSGLMAVAEPAVNDGQAHAAGLKWENSLNGEVPRKGGSEPRF